jgi:hypothetical protein
MNDPIEELLKGDYQSNYGSMGNTATNFNSGGAIHQRAYMSTAVGFNQRRNTLK